jgi:hypothetical protein
MTRIRPSVYNTRPVLIPQKPALPACPICNKEVLLETAKTDENGHALHEECYLLRLKSEERPTGLLGTDV